MLWTLFIVLLVLWLLGVVSGYAVGGFLHILLVLALIGADIPAGQRPSCRLKHEFEASQLFVNLGRALKHG